jgi:hypothetical protein
MKTTVDIDGTAYEVTVPEAPIEEWGFFTYLHYLISIERLIARTLHSPGALTLEPPTAAGQEKTQVQPDLARVGELLRAAWSVEAMLRFPRRLSPHVVGYADFWAPTAAYYAVFLEILALYEARGAERRDADTRSGQAHDTTGRGPSVRGTHSAALEAIDTDMQSGRLALPLPWSLLCVREELVDREGYIGLPEDVEVMPRHALGSPNETTWWSYYALALRTTRRRQITAEIVKWKRENKTPSGRPRRRTPPGMRTSIDARLAPTSLFDFLLRLRMRSNHVDQDLIASGLVSETDAAAFHHALTRIVDTTLLVLEAHTRAAIGEETFAEIIKRYAHTASDGGQSRVERRVTALRSLE